MKHQFKNKKAFTLIELLIVIAIIGILFIVLISKVDFATDKAKATGVQTDFRSFQVAIESVALENAGLATFGWDTGDTNGNRIRDSYDKGDTNQNGVQDEGEVFVGSKTYGETWTNVYTLTNPEDADDKSAIAALEAAINKNLDPKLHITIADNLTITMANGAQDPWNTEYHGYYITNATVDNKDSGAIVIYSNGANQEFGSEHSIAGGVVTVNVPGNNVYGKDDYGMAVIYTYVNGYGEVKTQTSGFSVNQSTQGNVSNNSGTGGTEETEEPGVTELLEPGLYATGAIALVESGDIETAKNMIKTSWDDLLTAGVVYVTDGVVYSNFDLNTKKNASSDALDGDLVLPNDGSITSIGNGSWLMISGNYVISGNLAFRNCKKLTGIAIPKSVTSITDGAFSYCDGLMSIEIPNSVTIIGNHVFDDCDGLANVTIGNSVTSIGEYAFYYCISLTSINIPDNVTSIGDSVLRFCTSLTSITIPDSITNISDYAFAYCRSLTNITIPDSVTSISDHGFAGCNSLTSVTIPDSVTTIDEFVFHGCSSLTSVTIGNSVTSISERAFGGCSSLTSINIPDSVTSISDYAFQQCTSLTSITIPDSVTSIGHAAFWDCTSLTSINIPDGVTTIETYTFFGCESLTSITIPDSITSIGEQAFQNCYSLTSVVIPDSVTIIDYRAFAWCDNLTSVVIGDGVVSIGEMAFYSCDKLTDLTIGSSVTIIYEEGFYDCFYIKNFTYNGTMEQWNAIEKVDYWHRLLRTTYVQCTDGSVKINQASW